MGRQGMHEKQRRAPLLESLHACQLVSHVLVTKPFLPMLQSRSIEGQPRRSSHGSDTRQEQVAEGAVQPPPPPPRKQVQQPSVEGRPGKSEMGSEVPADDDDPQEMQSAAPSPAGSDVQPLPQSPGPAAAAPDASYQPAGEELATPFSRRTAPHAERKLAADSSSLRLALGHPAAGQQESGTRHIARHAAPSLALPPPPPPPADSRRSPLSLQPSSTVKPGVSWRSMVAGVPDEQAASPAPLKLSGDAADKAAGKRGRGKKHDGKADPADLAPSGAVSLSSQPATFAAAAVPTKQRSKRAGRGKKLGVSEDGSQQGVLQEEEAPPAVSLVGKTQPGRSRGRGRGKDTVGQKVPQPGPSLAGTEAAASAAWAAGVEQEPVEEPIAALEPQPSSASTPAALYAVASDMPADLQPESPAHALHTHAASSATSSSAGAPSSMPAAFGWSSPLADEVAKLQLSASTAAKPVAAASLGGSLSGGPLVATHMALLPTLGRDLREPSMLLQPAAQPTAVVAQAAPGPASDAMADVITSLPADLTLDLGAAQPHVAPQPPAHVERLADAGGSPGPPFPSPPPPSASPPPFPGGLFPSASSSWQAQPPSKVTIAPCCLRRCLHYAVCACPQ